MTKCYSPSCQAQATRECAQCYREGCDHHVEDMYEMAGIPSEGDFCLCDYCATKSISVMEAALRAER